MSLRSALIALELKLLEGGTAATRKRFTQARGRLKQAMPGLRGRALGGAASADARLARANAYLGRRAKRGKTDGMPGYAKLDRYLTHSTSKAALARNIHRRAGLKGKPGSYPATVRKVAAMSGGERLITTAIRRHAARAQRYRLG